MESRPCRPTNHEAFVLLPLLKDIDTHIDALVERLDHDYQDIVNDEDALFIIVVMRGGMRVACAVMDKLSIPHTYDYVQVDSYEGEQKTGEPVVNAVHIDPDKLAGRNVLIIDDICDTGETMSVVVGKLAVCNPSSLRALTLFWRRGCPVRPEYYGLIVEPGEFLLGFGLGGDNDIGRGWKSVYRRV